MAKAATAASTWLPRMLLRVCLVGGGRGEKRGVSGDVGCESAARRPIPWLFVYHPTPFTAWPAPGRLGGGPGPVSERQAERLPAPPLDGEAWGWGVPRRRQRPMACPWPFFKRHKAQEALPHFGRSPSQAAGNKIYSRGSSGSTPSVWEGAVAHPSLLFWTCRGHGRAGGLGVCRPCVEVVCAKAPSM